MNIAEGCYGEKFDASYVRNNRINVMQIHVLSAGVRVTLSFIEFNQLSSASIAAAGFERCEVHFGMQFAGRISSFEEIASSLRRIAASLIENRVPERKFRRSSSRATFMPKRRSETQEDLKLRRS